MPHFQLLTVHNLRRLSLFYAYALRPTLCLADSRRPPYWLKRLADSRRSRWHGLADSRSTCCGTDWLTAEGAATVPGSSAAGLADSRNSAPVPPVPWLLVPPGLCAIQPGLSRLRHALVGGLSASLWEKLAGRLTTALSGLLHAERRQVALNLCQAFF